MDEILVVQRKFNKLKERALGAGNCPVSILSIYDLLHTLGRIPEHLPKNKLSKTIYKTSMPEMTMYSMISTVRYSGKEYRKRVKKSG